MELNSMIEVFLMEKKGVLQPLINNDFLGRNVNKDTLLTPDSESDRTFVRLRGSTLIERRVSPLVEGTFVTKDTLHR